MSSSESQLEIHVPIKRKLRVGLLGPNVNESAIGALTVVVSVALWFHIHSGRPFSSLPAVRPAWTYACHGTSKFIT